MSYRHGVLLPILIVSLIAIVSLVAVAPPAMGQPPAVPGKAPATGSDAPAEPEDAAAEASARTVTLVPTRPGRYAYWTVSPAGSGGVAALLPETKSVRIVLSPATREIQVLNEADGTLAVVAAAPLKSGATVRVAPQDFTRIRILRTNVTAAGGKPVASAVVTLVDAAGKRAQRVLTAADRGRAEFGNVLLGRATLTAAYGQNGAKTTQEVTVAPGMDGRPPEIALALPGDVPTVEVTAAPEPIAAPRIPEPLPTPEPPAERTGDGPSWIGGVLGIGLLAAIVYFGLHNLRARGVTVAGALRGMGVEMPQDAQANLAAPLSPPPPAAPPLPPLADLPAAGPAPAAPPSLAGTAAAPSAPALVGPRLVGVAGSALGIAVSLEVGTISIGRDPGNTLALVQDTTVSRRHARVEAHGNGWAVVDEGSSNGTWVNGVRTPGQVLEPGDEIQIGSARFRFER